MEEAEVWKPIPEYNHYEVSSLGNVRSYLNRNGRGHPSATSRLMKRHLSNMGYLFVGLRKDGRKHSRFVHQLVLLAFVGKRPIGYQCAHNDGCRTNSTLSNLRYATVLENNHDKFRHGTVWHARGELCGTSKLTAEKVVDIRRKRAAGVELKVIAAEYGIDISHISAVARGKKWAHIPLQSPKEPAT